MPSVMRMLDSAASSNRSSTSFSRTRENSVGGGSRCGRNPPDAGGVELSSGRSSMRVFCLSPPRLRSGGEGTSTLFRLALEDVLDRQADLLLAAEARARLQLRE